MNPTSILSMLPCVPKTDDSRGNPIAGMLQMVQSMCTMLPSMFQMFQGFTGTTESPEAQDTGGSDDVIDISDDLAHLLKEINDYKNEIRQIVNVAKKTRTKRAQTAGD